MHGVEEKNATELLKRFGRVQIPGRKGTVRKDRKSEDISLHPVAPNELGGGESNKERSENLNSCSAKRIHESDVLFNLKNSNWVSVPGETHFNARFVDMSIYPGFRSWNLI